LHKMGEKKTWKKGKKKEKENPNELVSFVI
jgi:hypothetical protein